MTLIQKSSRALEALTDEQEYRLLYAATFAIFLPAALVIGLFRSLFGGERIAGSISLFAEAKATVISSLAFAFMG